MRRKVIVALVIAIAIAISGVSAALLNGFVSESSASPQFLYRYKAKFEAGYQRAAYPELPNSVLIIDDARKYAFFGWYEASAGGLMPVKYGWELLKKTIYWATGGTPPIGTSIALIWPWPAGDPDSLAVYNMLTSALGPYPVTTFPDNSIPSPATLATFFDLAIYWSRVCYNPGNIISSTIPFITVCTGHTDEMEIGTGVTTLNDERDKFCVVDNSYIPTWGYPLGTLTFKFAMGFDATEAAGNGISIVSTGEVEHGISVETLVRTHINVYNPNDFNVTVTKYFVKVLREDGIINNITNTVFNVTWDGRTKPIHILVPARKGFEIDWLDIITWPPDPNNPIDWPPACGFWKGFVIIECWDYPLEVVAVYDKESTDIVNKITFHIRWDPYPIYTLRGTFKLNEPHELTVSMPFEPENITLPELVKRELGIIPPFEPEDVDIEIVETKVHFDFLECVSKETIIFKLLPTDTLLEKWLNETWPPPERPEGWSWPEWFKPCITLEKVVKIPRLDEIRVPEEIVRKEIIWTLLGLGVPLNVVDHIMAVLKIEIIEVDVAEGGGTSRDVEYIEAEVTEILP